MSHRKAGRDAKSAEPRGRREVITPCLADNFAPFRLIHSEPIPPHGNANLVAVVTHPHGGVHVTPKPERPPRMDLFEEGVAPAPEALDGEHFQHIVTATRHDAHNGRRRFPDSMAL